jgi:hypothetical protein
MVSHSEKLNSAHHSRLFAIKVGLKAIMVTSPAVALAAFEARTIHKLRMRIVPFVFVLYVIAFLDRINIGFAALTMNILT